MNPLLFSLRILAASETRAICLTVATAMALPFISRKALILVLFLWVIISRLVARGGRNRCRPINSADSEIAKQSARCVMNEDMPTEKRPLALVTGTNSGIGYHTAVGLAAEGYMVVVTCRSQALTQETADRVRAEAEKQRALFPNRYRNCPKHVNVIGLKPIECDDFDSVRSFVSWFMESFEDHNFQVLVNNAGGMRSSLGYSKFNPHLEYHTAANFLGPMLLTELLLPLLEKNGGRVVYVSSVAHRLIEACFNSCDTPSDPNRIATDNVLDGKLLCALKELNQGMEKSAGPLVKDSLNVAFIRYGTSKLLNTYHAHVIARRYRDVPDPKRRVFACSLHPGVILSGFVRGMGLPKRLNFIFNCIGIFFCKTSAEGAQTTLHCAMCPIEELELVIPPTAEKADDVGSKRNDISKSEDMSVSPYFIDCVNQTNLMLGKHGWDVKEAEMIISWAKEVLDIL